MNEAANSRNHRSLSHASLTRLRHDPLLAIAMATWLLSVISYVVPGLGFLRADFAVTYLELALLALAVALFIQAALRSPQQPVRLFWGLFAVGFGFWLLARLSTKLAPESVSWNPDLVSDVLYLGHYACVIVAVELRLESRHDPLWLINYGTSALTGVLLLVSVFGYFSLVPFIADSTAYNSYFYLDAAIDTYLAARMILAASQCNEKSWVPAYWALATTFVMIAVADVLAWVYRAGLVVYERDSGINIIWLLWYSAAYLASRVMLGSVRNTVPLNQIIYPAASVLLIFGLALPLVHLAGYGFGWLNTSAVTERTIYVFIWTLLVGTILLLFHWLMRRKIIDLTRERGFAESKAEDLEQQLDRTQRMAMLGRLSAGLAHDFGNTISAINMHAKLMVDKADTGEIDRRDIEGVNLGVSYAQDLIDKLRVFGATDRSTATGPLDIVLEVRDTLQLIGPSLDPRIRLQFGGSAAHAWALADKADVHRVLINYLYNALDAIGTDGEIAVDVVGAEVHEKCASCAAMFDGRFVRLSVADNGRGVDPELLNHLFEPLITSKSEGTGGGLGLATVHGIVHRHGGHVGLTTSKSGGSCFSAYFVAAKH
jgi:signal transduction histidine kinase